jgi:Swi5-dependent recombination DNA repair protein 1
MATPPAPKRRRLNDALHKPFKSPMRPPFQPNANPSVASPLSREPLQALDSTKENVENALGEGTPIKRKPLLKPAPAAISNTTDPLVLSTQKEIRRLDLLSIRYRQENDTLSQAVSILASTKSAELEALTLKWRNAARLAAEEVFAGARDKVNRMGGVGAWRERENERKGFAEAWESEPVKSGGGGDDDDDDEDESDGAGQNKGEREGEVYERDERLQVVEDDWDYDKGRVEGEKKERDVGGADDDVSIFYPVFLCSDDVESTNF